MNKKSKCVLIAQDVIKGLNSGRLVANNNTYIILPKSLSEKPNDLQVGSLLEGNHDGNDEVGFFSVHSSEVTGGAARLADDGLKRRSSTNRLDRKMGRFHLVIVNKFLDSFASSLLAEKVDAAMKLAEETFSEKCKSSKGKEKSPLAHFKLFADPLDASSYAVKIKDIQKQYGEHKKEKKIGSPEEWATKAISELK
jgi:hypothetical protein